MKLYQKILWCALGTLMLGGGCGMLVRVAIGSDSLSCFYEGLSLVLPISLGTVSLLMNVLYVIIVFFLDKKKIGVATFIFMFLGAYPIDFMYEHFFTPDSLIIAILLDVVICVIIGTGCAMIVKSDLGATAYDGLTLSTSEVLKKNYVVVRYIYDGAFLIFGILLGAKVGVGTIIALVLIGPVFNYARKLLIK